MIPTNPALDLAASPSPEAVSPAPAGPREAEPSEDNIRGLVDAFYLQVRADPLLGPVFGARLDGRWDEHLPKMVAFWSNLVLGTKGYRGNLQARHQPLEGVEPAHFSRWLALFLRTVEARYQPAAAVRFMEPALRIAQSLQLSRFGWDYRIPDEQQALLDAIAPKRQREDDAHPARPRGEPFPARIIGRGADDGA
ncbi:group III truncated hemoglobin [Burkholderia gladioli]|uniref:group III truncated hemoglobin n=1 Tax=Burkholderia gladioli TaxID=28095 RepID=UPI001F49B6B4|nr:group III truncated hemoglobin [Burkholderia gladioli]